MDAFEVVSLEDLQEFLQVNVVDGVAAPFGVRRRPRLR